MKKLVLLITFNDRLSTSLSLLPKSVAYAVALILLATKIKPDKLMSKFPYPYAKFCTQHTTVCTCVYMYTLYLAVEPTVTSQETVSGNASVYFQVKFHTKLPTAAVRARMVLNFWASLRFPATIFNVCNRHRVAAAAAAGTMCSALFILVQKVLTSVAVQLTVKSEELVWKNLY